MVKTAQEISERYAEKFDAEVAKSRATNVRDTAIARQAEASVHQAELNQAIRTLLNENGVSALQTIQYLSFAKKLDKLVRKLGGATAIMSATAEFFKWQTLGADADTLTVVWEYFGTLGEAPTPLV